ncbi:MAG: hypothetical protein ACI89T_002005 [Cognaticolwellia sp.]|jgi:hypothetical protein
MLHLLSITGFRRFESLFKLSDFELKTLQDEVLSSKLKSNDTNTSFEYNTAVKHQKSAKTDLKQVLFIINLIVVLH